MNLNIYGVLFLISLTTFVVSEGPNSLQIEINQGALKGRHWKTEKGRIFNGFTGIPYAHPPVGSLRFKPPVPITSWNGVLDATKSHDVCPQISIYLPGFPILGDEDCLYLNVYTPKLPNADNELLPVMFYIHGGSFLMGSAKPEWLGPELLLEKDIVLVTINYRLGALGFLSTADNEVPGNNGLKDQSLALRWVRDNIAHFGGDPEKITVFGNSAGSLSVHLQMLSPLSRDLINSAILQSGSAASNYAIISNDQSLSNAEKLGMYLNCPTTSTRELVGCLRNIDAKEIVTKEAKFSSWDNETTMPFRPVLEEESDNAFISEYPLETLKSGKVANIPLMTGIVAQEAAYKTSSLFSKPKLLKILDKLFDVIIPPTFGISADKKNVSKAIRKFYFNNSRIDNTTAEGVTNMYSDGWFVLNNDITVRLHKQYTRTPIYQYLFNYRGSTSYSTLFGDPYNDYGVSHTDELLYLFKLGMTFPNYEPTELDSKVSELLTTLWANFASTGNPNFIQANLDSITTWDPVHTNALEYYHIRSDTDMKMETCMYSERVNFWRELPIERIPDSEISEAL